MVRAKPLFKPIDTGCYLCAFYDCNGNGWKSQCPVRGVWCRSTIPKASRIICYLHESTFQAAQQQQRYKKKKKKQEQEQEQQMPTIEPIISFSFILFFACRNFPQPLMPSFITNGASRPFWVLTVQMVTSPSSLRGALRCLRSTSPRGHEVGFAHWFRTSIML